MLEIDSVWNGHLRDYQLISSVLKSCAALSAISWGKTLHAGILRKGFLACNYVSKALLNMYAKCGALNDCTKLFGEIGNYGPDTVFWNILLSGFAGSQSPVHHAETLRLFNAMRASHQAKPSSVTAAIILPVCARIGDVNTGKGIHCYATKSGLATHTVVGNALVSMYAKCRLVDKDAYVAFSGIKEKDVVSWNAIIAGFSENKLKEGAFSLFNLMLRDQIKPNHATIASILPVCASMDKNAAYCLGKEIHCYALRHNEFFADASVCNALISFYSKVGYAEEAELLFRRMESKDLVSWNSLIAGYATNDDWSTSLKLFHELVAEIIWPDSVTLVTILPVCAQLKHLQLGREIHGYVLRHFCLYQDISVGNALVKFYAKCGKTEAAYYTFLMICRRDIISWNSMLDAFVEGRRDTQFIALLQWMFKEGIRPDYITILAILQFCSNVSELDKVKETHGYSIRCGLSSCDVEPTFENALLDAYAKCGEIEYAFKVFQTLSENRNLISFNSLISGYVSSGMVDDACMIFNRMHATDLTTWNLMIRAYAENDCNEQALDLFHQLQARRMKPDTVTIMGLLPVCTQIASLHLVRQCHGYVIRSCFEDMHMEAALLDVYAKCGGIGCAFKLFKSNPNKDLVMFTAMVSGYAMHGMGEDALKVFSCMHESNVKPDHVIITAVLSACSHSGLIDEGLKIFYSMEKLYGMKPTVEQYSCVVDLLARGGRINDAFSVVTGMPIEANANVWGTLLGACRMHHEVELGKFVADHLFQIEASNIGNYVVLSNLYAADAKWDEVMKVRKLMKIRDLKKPAGCSWIEVERINNLFVASDSCHPERSIIFTVLGVLDQHIKNPFKLSEQLGFSL
ncbi:hypothetical protein K2173_000986 [Erythroxylum novogranatense]|uniref:Pentatricopeptide repeat-containing protein n=1 Tax=Erythroxylum novogranatense TaxID=1862640 RepID=A0AAV8TQI0_9ROSI|nr:hypothetical protein K2173_000986 [Erythroxylum novogranatense]